MSRNSLPSRRMNHRAQSASLQPCAPETRPPAPPPLRSSRARCKARWRLSGASAGADTGSVSALTVTPATSAAVPRHPACEAATNWPDRSAVRIGAQSATWTATTRSGDVGYDDVRFGSAAALRGRDMHRAAVHLRESDDVARRSARPPPQWPPSPHARRRAAPRNVSCRVVQPCATAPSARHCRARPHGAATHANSPLTSGGTSHAL